MSERPKQPAYIHREEFNETIEKLGTTMTESLGKFAQEMDDNTSKKINANAAEFSKGMDAMNQRIDQLTNAVNQIVGHIQQAPQQNTNKFTDLANQAQQILELPIVKQKLGLESPPDPNEGLAQLAVKGMQRELNKQLLGIVKRQFKRGNLFEEEVAEHLSEKAVSHGI